MRSDRGIKYSNQDPSSLEPKQVNLFTGNYQAQQQLDHHISLKATPRELAQEIDYTVVKNAQGK